MKKVSSIIMLFVMGLNMFNPVWINAKEIDDKNEDEKVEVSEANVQNAPIDPLASTDIVTIPDDNLKACINGRLGQADSSDITVAQMESLTSLSCAAKGIQDLSGLQAAKNVDNLGFAVNKISDLSPIKGLNNLMILDFSKNEISDLTPLSGLNKLSFVMMNRNQISDLTPLNTTQIKDIQLNHNQISDLTPLKNMTDLETLELNANPLADLTPLADIKNLKNLSLQQDNLTDISALSKLTNLESLALNINDIKDISPISGLTKLRALTISWNEIEDISSLSGLTNLEMFQFYDNQISDMSLVQNFSKLEILGANANKISDISAVKNLTNLKELGFGENQVSDMSAVKNLTKLTILDFNSNQISDISAIENLTKLNTLYMFDNQISDISAIKNSTNLMNIYMKNNQVSDFSPINSSTVYTFENSEQHVYIDLGELNNLNITNVYKAKIVEKDGIEHEVVIPLDNVKEGVNNYTQNYDFGNGYDGIVDLTFNYTTLPNQAPKLEGVNDVTIKKGDSFNPMDGVSATDAEDGDLTSKIVVDDSKLQLDTVGEYTVSYSVTDSSSETTTADRKVTVVATNEKPVIDGINDVTLNLNDSFDPMQGVSATDKEDGDLTSKISITKNDLDSSKVGNYKITYSVTDSDGNKIDGSRNIKVVDNSTSKPGDGGDITQMKPGTDDKDNTLSKTGSNMLVISIVGISALLLIKKSYKL